MSSGHISTSGDWARTALRFAAAILLTLACLTATAQTASANPKYAAMVVDANTGETLFARHADAKRYPASLTKIMTLYVVFEELRAGRMALDTPIKVSAHAAKQVPSKIGFKPGQTIETRDAIRALVTKSANDVAAAVAEHISGSEGAFAERMTRTARRLGMSSTTYKNASGLPNSAQVTTARDQIRLGIAIQRNFPVYYSYFQTRSFTYRGVAHRNHNRLLGRVEGVDGIKTGFINASGFNLVTSVKRDGRYIVAAVFGGRTGRSRDAHMEELIATYIKKARPGAGGALIARNVPVPAARPAMPVALALAEPDTGATQAVQKATTMAVEEGKPLAAPATGTPRTLTPELIAAYAASVHADAMEAASEAPMEPTDAVGSYESPEDAEEATETVIAAAAAPKPTSAAPSGWHVQIAATQSESEARSLLRAAQEKNSNVLGGRDLYTEAVDVNGTTLYRARFTGFSTKSEAWSACSQLKKRKLSCWALNPAS
ncbi:D-alanyl-D-alanine carboxypeptidase [Amorphus orientalis]|uniref:D-alanyl-D-alanine carboxypeptidase n=1 Tax=Amorphus orientalis TaxID=649198 RepID=A0AAE4AU94_9HYPH|nr:D-alanyl-D-alanine carboxypeptidase [Amorphus orientalis]MDQ0317130.1 D-alanyl-D-alanine carboxypeptidase [Amorphus orientalis]